jgi:hypothetical protein
MKNLLLLALNLLLSLSVWSQFIYTDFDGNEPVVFSGYPNSPTKVANHNPSGINTSANDGKWIRTIEQCVLVCKLSKYFRKVVRIGLLASLYYIPN